MLEIGFEEATDSGIADGEEGGEERCDRAAEVGIA
jgi:hypothetical protein